MGASYYKAGRAGYYWLGEENDGRFLGDSYYSEQSVATLPCLAVGITQDAPIIFY